MINEDVVERLEYAVMKRFESMRQDIGDSYENINVFVGIYNKKDKNFDVMVSGNFIPVTHIFDKSFTTMDKDKRMFVTAELVDSYNIDEECNLMYYSFTNQVIIPKSVSRDMVYLNKNNPMLNNYHELVNTDIDEEDLDKVTFNAIKKSLSSNKLSNIDEVSKDNLKFKYLNPKLKDDIVKSKKSNAEIKDAEVNTTLSINDYEEDVKTDIFKLYTGNKYLRHMSKIADVQLLSNNTLLKVGYQFLLRNASMLDNKYINLTQTNLTTNLDRKNIVEVMSLFAYTMVNQKEDFEYKDRGKAKDFLLNVEKSYEEVLIEIIEGTVAANYKINKNIEELTDYILEKTLEDSLKLYSNNIDINDLISRNKVINISGLFQIHLIDKTRLPNLKKGLNKYSSEEFVLILIDTFGKISKFFPKDRYRVIIEDFIYKVDMLSPVDMYLTCMDEIKRIERVYGSIVDVLIDKREEE